MSRSLRSELNTELALMEYSEQEIYELQSILRSKVGDHVPVIKKAMDIEDFFYKDAIYKSGVNEKGVSAWESMDFINKYANDLDTFKLLMQAKQGDWTKLFNQTDIRTFCTQVTSSRTIAKKKVSKPSAYSVPAPNNLGTNKKSKRGTKATVPAPKKKSGGNKKAPATIPNPVSVPNVSAPPVEFRNYEEPLPDSSAAADIDGDVDLFNFDIEEDSFLTAADGSADGGAGVANAAAWGNLDDDARAPVRDTAATSAGWDTAALEERRRNQAFESGAEMHRTSQQEELKRARERGILESAELPEDDGGSSQPEGMDWMMGAEEGELDLNTQREMERRQRESEGQDVNLDSWTGLLEDFSDDLF